MDAIPVCLGQVHDRGAPCDPGIIHQNVDFAKSLDRLAHHPINVLEVANVRLQCQTAPPQVHHRTAGLFGLLAIEICDRHVGSCLRQRQRRGLANALASAGDQRHLIAQYHACLLAPTQDTTVTSAPV